MLQKRKANTPMQRMLPATKMWLALALILAIMVIRNYALSFALIAVSVVMIILEKKTALFKLLVVTMIIMFISMYGIHGAIAPTIDKANDSVMFSILGIDYYAKGFAYASHYYLRVIPLMCALFLIFTTMDIADLGATLCKIGIPYKGVFTFIDSFQVMKLLGKEMNQIRDAQCARGLETGGNIFSRFKAFIPIMVPVVASAIVKVQDQAIAMDTKGFNSPNKKTVYRDLPETKFDLTIKYVSIFVSIAVIAYGVLVARGVIEPFLTNIS